MLLGTKLMAKPVIGFANFGQWSTSLQLKIRVPLGDRLPRSWGHGMRRLSQGSLVRMFFELNPSAACTSSRTHLLPERIIAKFLCT